MCTLGECTKEESSCFYTFTHFHGIQGKINRVSLLLLLLFSTFLFLSIFARVSETLVKLLKGKGPTELMQRGECHLALSAPRDATCSDRRSDQHREGVASHLGGVTRARGGKGSAVQSVYTLSPPVQARQPSRVPPREGT